MIDENCPIRQDSESAFFERDRRSIKVICPGSRNQAGEIVSLAFTRSCSSALVARTSLRQLVQAVNHTDIRSSNCWVLIDPPDVWSECIISALQVASNKVIIFGAIPPKLANFLSMEVMPCSQDLVEAAKCSAARSNQFSQSAASVLYTSRLGNFESPVQERAFLRYDFADEWNNLGYGAIEVDESLPSIWALAQLAKAPSTKEIAQVHINGQSVGTYSAVWDFKQSSLLWFNRAVGPVDSQEWALVEHFLASYRFTALPCWPVLREVPYGYAAAVTMRLDCDEDIESARQLCNAYRLMEVPFSLALHSKVLSDTKHHMLPREVLLQGGALLSHTATHAPDWGGSYAAAFWEGSSSAETIEQATGYKVRYAVSPFHQTPDYARAALADAGYAGCIGGIIRNDPDFLLARSGQVCAAGEGFIGHTQQHMMHGDCVVQGSDGHTVFKQAFNIARAGGAFFGYLDHPFSQRYQYGWHSEEQRVEFHRSFIGYIRETANVLFCNETDALDFMSFRATVKIVFEEGHFSVCVPSKSVIGSLAVEYRGEIFEASKGCLWL